MRLARPSFLSAVSSVVAQGAVSGWTPEPAPKIGRVEGARVSPDGSRVAFAVDPGGHPDGPGAVVSLSPR